MLLVECFIAIIFHFGYNFRTSHTEKSQAVRLARWLLVAGKLLAILAAAH